MCGGPGVQGVVLGRCSAFAGCGSRTVASLREQSQTPDCQRWPSLLVWHRNARVPPGPHPHLNLTPLFALMPPAVQPGPHPYVSITILCVFCMPPQYVLVLEEGDHFLLAGRKRKSGAQGAEYTISVGASAA